MNPGGYRLLGMWVLLIGVLVVGFDAAMLSQPGSGETYDLVLQGGRVIDPETGFDAVAHVGIDGDTVSRISLDPLVGSTTLNATATGTEATQDVQRERMAELLDVDPAQLADLVNPPKSMDDAAGQ